MSDNATPKARKTPARRRKPAVKKTAENATPVAENLPAATAIAVGDDGALYVAIKGNLAGVGQVLRIVP